MLDPAMDPSAVDAALAEQALRRRAEWSNAAEARAYFSTRKAFAGFRGDSMEALLAGGTRDAGDGVKVVLKCQPASETAVYRGRGLGGDALWRNLGEVLPLSPAQTTCQ